MALKIKWNNSAFREIRLLPAVDADVQDRADRIADAAGAGYEARRTDNPRNRARAAVVTTNRRAMLDNARHQTLLRSLDSGR